MAALVVAVTARVIPLPTFGFSSFLARLTPSPPPNTPTRSWPRYPSLLSTSYTVNYSRSYPSADGIATIDRYAPPSYAGRRSDKPSIGLASEDIEWRSTRQKKESASAVVEKHRCRRCLLDPNDFSATIA